eukprot:SAG22_NODE_4553_length_1236_cov_1.618294_1_plen_116_part_10
MCPCLCRRHGVGAIAEPTISCGGHVGSVGHTCVKCGGQFKIALTAPGKLLVNYVFLQPGQWGRVPGLPVLLSAAETLKSMGIKAIRQGEQYHAVTKAVGNMMTSSADFGLPRRRYN